MKKFLTALTPILLLSQFSGTVFAFEDCKSDRKIWTRCEGTKALGDDIYSGEWRNDKPHGQGTIIHNLGDKYEGQFKNGRRDGQGTMTYASGKIQEGVWEDGEYLGSTAIEIEQNKIKKRQEEAQNKKSQNKKRQEEAQNKKRQFYYNGKNYYECEAVASLMTENRKDYEQAMKTCDKHINSRETITAKQEIEARAAKQEREARAAKQKNEARMAETHSGPSENTKYLFIIIILIIIIISGIVHVNKSKTDPIKTHNSNKATTSSDKDFLTTLLICVFLGGLGVHRFFVDKIGTGILMLITLGGLGLWWIIDIILIVIGSFEDSEGKVIAYQATGTANREPAKDIPDEIRKFAELKKDGLITEEEFDKKKKELLK